MKKIMFLICTLLLLASASKIKAQQLPYAFTTYSQTFQYLAAPTIFTASTQTLSIPFPFFMFSTGLTTPSVNMTGDGYINFGGEGIVSYAGGMNGTKTYYETTGSAPSRIFKIEWRGHQLSQSASTADSITYQVWLYETTNMIEWHFGPNNWFAGSFTSGPFVMLVNGSAFYSISGSPNTPTFTVCGVGCHLNGIPNPGTVYRLNPTINTVPVNPPSKILSLVPNPSNEKVTIHNCDKNSIIVVSDIAGKVLERRIARGGNEEFSLSMKGFYYVTVASDKSTITHKLVIE
jgi:hypothetical protein